MAKERNKQTTVYRKGTLVRGTDRGVYVTQSDGPAHKKIRDASDFWPAVWVDEIIHEPLTAEVLPPCRDAGVNRGWAEVML